MPAAHDYARLVAALATLLLVTVRLAPAALVTPLLGARVLPPGARAALLAALALGVYPAALAAPSSAAALGPAALAQAVLVELLVGGVLALHLALPFVALEHAGRLLDAARGASNAELTALDGGARTSPLAELLRVTGLAAFVLAGGLRAVAVAAARSLALVPPGGAVSPGLGALALAAARVASASLTHALPLATAGLCALVAVEAALALAARLAPALGHAQLALPLRTLAPVAALALALRAGTEAAVQLAGASLAAAAPDLAAALAP